LNVTFLSRRDHNSILPIRFSELWLSQSHEGLNVSSIIRTP